MDSLPHKSMHGLTMHSWESIPCYYLETCWPKDSGIWMSMAHMYWWHFVIVIRHHVLLICSWLSGVSSWGHVLPQWDCKDCCGVCAGAGLQQGCTQLPAHSSSAEHVQTYIHQPSYGEVTGTHHQSPGYDTVSISTLLLLFACYRLNVCLLAWKAACCHAIGD